jgi:hypothetical protein
VLIYRGTGGDLQPETDERGVAICAEAYSPNSRSSATAAAALTQEGEGMHAIVKGRNVTTGLTCTPDHTRAARSGRIALGRASGL